MGLNSAADAIGKPGTGDRAVGVEENLRTAAGATIMGAFGGLLKAGVLGSLEANGVGTGGLEPWMRAGVKMLNDLGGPFPGY